MNKSTIEERQPEPLPNSEQKPIASRSAQVSPMQCYAQPGIEMYHADNLEVMSNLPDESVDVICIDPPYLYLKGQKLERRFDEHLFFNECKRLMTKNGFIVLFGRGTSFYRWNTILSDLGFVFKEEVVWNKIRNSIPAAPLSRVHELVSIYSKSVDSINRVYVPYLEQKAFDFEAIKMDIDRIKSALNTKELDAILKYLESGEISYREKKSKSFFKRGYGCGSRGVDTIKTITNGMVEKSIIKIKKPNSERIHPTQKPVRLLERLLALVIPRDKSRESIVIADFFAGSMSTMEACYNLGLKGIAVEIDKEYFEDGKKRIENLPSRQTMLFE